MADKRDYKKEYRDLYQPGKRPSLVDVPPIPMFLVDGAGDPSGAAYQAAMSALYAVTFTLKMSRLGPWQPEGYFDYVLPPLEGFWWTEEGGHDLLSVPRSTWRWTSALRAPEYATPQVLRWALEECARKKPGVDLSGVRLETVTEGLCVQCMHIGHYDDEPATVAAMEEYAKAQGYEADFGEGRFHHEIYLSDVRRCKPERMKTVIRHPTKRTE
mgnify:CR=1 FL=1